MRIDAHTHIFPPGTVEDRGSFFPGEPAFRLLYESPKARLTTAEGLLEAMDREEVDRSVVFGFPWEDGERSRRHNDYVLESAARHGDRLIPLACFNPLEAGALEEADRCLENGARGLGELALYGRCDEDEALDRLGELAEACRRKSAILLVHANEPVGHSYPGKAPMGLRFYYELARRASGIPLILAHWGGGLCFYELLKKEAGEVLKDVCYDTAASPYLYRKEIYSQMTRVLGREKILFGSDYPLLSPSRYFREMEAAGLEGEDLKAVAGGNAARLFGLSG